MSLEEKCAIVFGGVGGIGREVCKALLSNGCKVVAADVAPETDVRKVLEQIGDRPCFKYMRCDITKADETNDCFQFAKDCFKSPVDIVVNCAGTIDEFNWNNTIEVNLKGTINLTLNALKHMSKENPHYTGGAVVNISSVAGIYGESIAPIYASTKAGIIALTKSYANDDHYKTHGIRFNVVCPIHVDTAMGSTRRDKLLLPKKTSELKKISSPLQPSAVSDCILKLIKSSTCNGKVVFITKENGEAVSKEVDVILKELTVVL